MLPTLPFQPGTPTVLTVDGESRVALPPDFANATVTVRVVSANVVLIQRAADTPPEEPQFIEEMIQPLSNRDRDFLLDMIENPPPPTPAFLAAAAKYKKSHG